MFEKQVLAGWADMDSNGHMRNTAFLDKSADVRMMFFSKETDDIVKSGAKRLSIAGER